MQLDHAFQNVRSKNARFKYVRKLRQNVRADATKMLNTWRFVGRYKWGYGVPFKGSFKGFYRVFRV